MANPDMADRAPRAPVERTVLELHGVERVDDYFWLKDAEREQTSHYLGAERGFYDAQVAHTRLLRESIFDEMNTRTLPTEHSVSWRGNGSDYYTHTVWLGPRPCTGPSP